MDRRLSIWGYVRNGPNDGYGYAGLKIAETLEELDIKVTWEDETAPIALNFKQPIDYGGTVNQYVIGYTPWESTELPDQWANIINWSCQEFWTTSNFCADVFEKGGVRLKPRVVHHGIDPDTWTISRRKKDGPFIFLHQGEPAERKGGQMVFDAFKEVFSKTEDVHLVYKSVAWVEARWKEGEKIKGAVNTYPNVHIINGYYTQEQMNELYTKAHCMVYPSNGEGFGLIPFQAVATGMPTIAPAWGGIADFSDYLFPIDYKVGPTHHDYHLGEWCYPSFDTLCAAMEAIYRDYDNARYMAYSMGGKLRNDFSWKKILEPVVADLEAHF